MDKACITSEIVTELLRGCDDVTAIKVQLGQKGFVSHLCRSLEANPHMFLIDSQASWRHRPKQLLGVVVDWDGAGQGVVDGSCKGVRKAR